jgi:tetratricopeptide (TPR) repeat protein
MIFKLSKCLLLSVILVMLLFLQQAGFAQEPTFGKVSPVNSNINAINDCITHHNKGIAFMEAGYPLHAIDEFKLALMLNPNSTMSATVYNNMGRAYEMMRSYNLAITCYQHAIKINPDFSLYYKNLVNAYRAKKALKQAQVDYEKIVKINSQDAQAYFILALIYMGNENNTRALQAFKKVVSLEPNIELTRSAQKYITKLGATVTNKK